MAKMGRPVESVPTDIADKVIAWISNGNTLRAFSRQRGVPSYATLYNWAKKDDDFAQRLARARESGEDAIAEECVEIADSATDANLAKMRIWTRLELLKCWNPRKYGAKIEHSGEVGIKTVLLPAPSKDATALPACRPAWDEE